MNGEGKPESFSIGEPGKTGFPDQMKLGKIKMTQTSQTTITTSTQITGLSGCLIRWRGI